MPWSRLPAELKNFAEELARVSATEDTGRALLSSHFKFLRQWKEGKLKSEVEGIPIPPPRNKGLHPTGVDVNTAYLQFEFELGDIGQQENWNGPAKADFQICVKGELHASHVSAELEDHWRVDTHQYKDDKGEPHPKVHFQRGGYAQEAFSKETAFIPGVDLPACTVGDCWRALMQCPGPRIALPPMCPILAIDFAVSQHDGALWGNLRRNGDYAQLVRAAQNRLWVPYFEGMTKPDHRRKWIGRICVDA